MEDYIPNYFHVLYYSENKELKPYIFLSIKSIIEINNPSIIYFHYFNIPSGYLWNIIKDNLTLKKIAVPILYQNNLNNFYTECKDKIIYKKLLEYGGIYIDLNSICIKPIHLLLKNNFVKSKNNEIVCLKKNGKTIHPTIYPLNYKETNTDNIIFNEIHDYSFGKYFSLIKDSYILFLLTDIEKLNKINMNDVLNKITIYNLLVKNMLSYQYINNNNIICYDNIKMINNIDKIYWINLNISLKRRNNMIELLENINVENIRIEAIDGNLIDNVNTTYFYCNNNYPKYSNKEYAILLSHLNTIETFTKIDANLLKYGVALVLEDDISFDFIKYWNIDLQKIINNAPNDWDIIMLGYFSLNLNYNKYNKWNNEWSAISYLINYKIKDKINDLKENDKWICKEDDLMVSDNYIFSKFNTYIYKYPFFTFPNDNDSTFHSDHLQYHRLYKMCNYLVLNNIYDQFV